jgi:tetratricopeptide (TPR) repeat protein
MIHLLCQWSLIRALLPAAIAGVRPAKEDRFRAGLAAAARGDDARAEAEFRRVLLIDPADVEAHLNLGALLARHGRPVEARKLLRRCRRLDLEGKWAWEARQELRALEPAAGPDVAVPLRESGVPNGEADLQGRGR